MKTGPYMPHLSLLYADITDAQKAEVGWTPSQHAPLDAFAFGSVYSTSLTSVICSLPR